MRLRWNGGAAERRAREGLREGGREALEVICREAVSRTPVDTGALRACAHVEMEALEGRVVYPLPYAVPQHEREDYAHRRGGARFLSGAAQESAGEAGEAISRALSGRLS